MIEYILLVSRQGLLWRISSQKQNNMLRSKCIGLHCLCRESATGEMVHDASTKDEGEDRKGCDAASPCKAHTDV